MKIDKYYLILYYNFIDSYIIFYLENKRVIRSFILFLHLQLSRFVFIIILTQEFDL